MQTTLARPVALTLATLPALGTHFPAEFDLPGALFAGITTSPTGEVYALALLADKPDARLSWDAAMGWATSLSASLPTRPEAALLFANLRAAFEPSWHWTNEQYSASPGARDFGDGGQLDGVKAHEGRARAVRRFPLSA